MLDAYKKITHSIVNIVNALSRPTNKTIDALVSRVKRKQFLDDLSFAGQQRIVTGTLSEASIRLGKEYLLSASQGKHLVNLSDDDLDVYSIVSDWTLKRSTPPNHILWHQKVYQLTAAQAVLLCHPIHVFKMWTEYNKVQESGSSGSFTLADDFLVCQEGEIDQHLLLHEFLLIPGQGLLVWGKNLQEMTSKIEEVDWICALNL